MIFKVNGHDYLPYIEQKGLKWSLSAIDGDDAGRTMDGTMHRDLIAKKVRWDVKCLPLKPEEVAVVLNDISQEFVELEVKDPMYGHVTMTMYSNNIPATYIDTNTDKWEGIAFPLIER